MKIYQWKYTFLCLFFCTQYAFAQFNTIQFPNACAPGEKMVIAAVGDVLLHKPLQIKGQQTGFHSLWQASLPFIKSADIAYANLEGPMAYGVTQNGKITHEKNQRYDNFIYTSYPAFNYLPQLGTALKDSGFTLVSTANNHALDRFAIGIDRTIEGLNHAGVTYVGTRARGSNRSWVQIVNKQNFKIAWIACTEHTNDNIDKYHQLLHCYRKTDREFILKSIQELKHQVDAIIVTPHWGEEYQTHPNEEQTEFAHQVLNAGALAIIGSHPHVLQPLQKYMTNDGRATLIMYSLGNFVSYQGSPAKRSTVILLLGLTKTANGTIINGVRFVPMYMENRNGLDNLRLTPIAEDNGNALSYQIISRILPMGNALFSHDIVTNPECFK